MRVNIYKPGIMRAPLIREAAVRCKLYPASGKLIYDAGTAAIAASWQSLRTAAGLGEYR